jgi:hypothetical protein
VSVPVKVAGSYETVAATGTPSGPETVKLEVVSVSGSIEREKVALIGLSRSTADAPFGGFVLVTVNGGGGVAAVEKVHE